MPLLGSFIGSYTGSFAASRRGFLEGLLLKGPQKASYKGSLEGDPSIEPYTTIRVPFRGSLNIPEGNGKAQVTRPIEIAQHRTLQRLRDEEEILPTLGL